MKYNFDRFLSSYSDFLYRFRFAIIVFLPLVTIFIGKNLDLTFNPSYRVFFGENNPDMRAFDEYQLMFNKEDPVNIIIDASDSGGVFTDKNLRTIRKMTERIRNARDIPSFKRIMRVESITNYQHASADEFGLQVKDLIGEEDFNEADENGDLILNEKGNPVPKPLSADFLKRVKEIALSEPATLHRLISKDANVTQLIVTFNIPDLTIVDQQRREKGLPRLSSKERREITELSLSITDALNQVIEEELGETGLGVYRAGVLYMNRAFTTTIRDDFETINPLVFGVIILVSVFLFRSGWPVLMIFSVIIFSILFSFGVAGFLEVSLSGPNGMTFQILMAVGVADTIHILSSFYRYVGQNLDRAHAMKKAIQHNFLPCFFTSITTAIGFFSILLNEMPPIRTLGWITGIGVLYAFLVTVLFVPVLLTLLPIRDGKRHGKWSDEKQSHLYGRLLLFSAKNRKSIVTGSILLGIGISLFGFRLEAENDPTSYFRETHDINVSINFSDSRFTGMYLIEFALNTGVEGGIKEPPFLREVDEAKEWIERQEGVTHVFALTDVIKRINRLLNEDDSAHYRIPDTREQVAQALFNYTSSLPMGLDIQNQKSFDDAALRLVISAREMSAHEIKPLVEKITAYLNEHITMKPASVTGVRHLFNQMTLRASPKMMVSTFVALFLITLTLTLILRSFGIGLISMIPNVIPITIVFGCRGLMGHTIDLFSGLVACIAMGIVVDDTVHLLTRYTRNRRANLDVYTSLKRAMDQCGTPIVLTTIILCFGFAIMYMSEFANNSRLGVMTSCAIGLALWFDLVVVPATLLLLSKKESWYSTFEHDLKELKGR